MSKKDEKTALDPLAMVQSLDVDVLESRVTQIESEIAEYTAGRKRDLDALRTLLKAARIARDGKWKAATDEDGMNRFSGCPAREQQKELADKIESVLAEFGDAEAAFIAERLPYTELVVTWTLTMFPERFVKNHAGYWSRA